MYSVLLIWGHLRCSPKNSIGWHSSTEIHVVLCIKIQSMKQQFTDTTWTHLSFVIMTVFVQLYMYIVSQTWLSSREENSLQREMAFYQAVVTALSGVQLRNSHHLCNSRVTIWFHLRTVLDRYTDDDSRRPQVSCSCPRGQRNACSCPSQEKEKGKSWSPDSSWGKHHPECSLFI